VRNGAGMSPIAGGAASKAAVGADARSTIDRVGPNDLMVLATDGDRAPQQVAAVLMLATTSSLEITSVQEVVAERIRAVPRLRQRLARVPLGLGRPIWVDDPGFDVRQHVRTVRCPAPGDEDALLRVVTDTVVLRLRRDRPLWSATLVTDLAGGSSAMIVVFHHVLADGIGGLAILQHLVDDAPTLPTSASEALRPSRRELLIDALRSRLRALARLPSAARQLPTAAAELAPGSGVRAPRCSLNQPIGPRRALGVARATLATVRAVAHAHNATVNDVVLAAVAGALHTLLRFRGETVDTLVVTVPVSARRTAGATVLGNQVGVMPVTLPLIGDPLRRLEAIARITQNRKVAMPGTSAALLGPPFRALARLGMLELFINRQRLVNTFVTNLRGPETRLSFLGAPITDVIPVSLISGNVTITFAVLSYAGTLGVTVVADPEHCPDLPVLQRNLQRELDELTRNRSAVSQHEPSDLA
jgi:diacylglycerol O-acyltransferase / wax synthase